MTKPYWYKSDLHSGTWYYWQSDTRPDDYRIQQVNTTGGAFFFLAVKVDDTREAAGMFHSLQEAKNKAEALASTAHGTQTNLL